MATKKKVTIIIEDIEKSDFSKCCLNELKHEGVEEGMEIKGVFVKAANAVDFKSPKTGVDCVAWVGTTCRII